MSILIEISDTIFDQILSVISVYFFAAFTYFFCFVCDFEEQNRAIASYCHRHVINLLGMENYHRTPIRSHL